MIRHIYEKLLEIYGPQGWWPITQGDTEPKYGVPLEDEEQRLEIILGTILTQNTSWNNAMKAIVNLKRKDMINKRKLLNASQEELGKLIRSAGYFNQKAKKIRAFLENFPNDTEPERESLLKIWGIGPETADSILLYAYNKPEFVVDAYTTRMFTTYGLIRDDMDYEEIKSVFQRALVAEYKERLIEIYKEYHALIVRHGKDYYSRRPHGLNDPLIKEIME
ncbi:MAG: endonuclease III domain-containing protein [Candidatus Woesearchaeota archaeon]